MMERLPKKQTISALNLARNLWRIMLHKYAALLSSKSQPQSLFHWLHAAWLLQPDKGGKAG
jgi:hypothetical protein